jgi:murein DD-endopeptidase MepM/ murein hydrolase activator NlpD
MSTGSGSKRKREVSTNNTPQQNSQDPLTDLDSANVLDDPKPATSLENTPNANGETPSDQRAMATLEAECSIFDNTTDLQAQQPEEYIPSEIIKPATYPHYFQELEEQTFYHEVMIYIQGVDVSPWLQGSIKHTHRLNENPSTLNFTLNNAANRFILTPENLRGIFRLAPGEDYDETPKKTIWDFKSDTGNNPMDPKSGGRRWPLSHWGSIFHTMDPVRVWIKNPVDDPNSTNQWLPLFTGYITSNTKTENFVNAESSIDINCEDIRYIMQKMRVNTNSVMYVAGGEILGTNAADDQLTKEFKGPVNKQFDTSFFRALTARSEYDNPWASLSLRNLVKALTFSPHAQDVIDNAGIEQVAIYAQQIANLEQEITQAKKLEDKSTAEDLKKQLNSIQHKWTEAKSATVNGKKRQKELETYRHIKISDTPGKEQESPEGQLTTNELVTNSGRNSRLGSLQRGVFPEILGQKTTTIPSITKDRKVFLQNWYALVLFGVPNRDYSTTGDGTNAGKFGSLNGTLNFGTEYRYWSEEEVRKAGKSTLTDHAWRPDAQAVHMMEPGVSTVGEALFQELSIQSSPSTSCNRQWSNRLNLICDACKAVDYRFWISGSGDFIFEPPLYDFNPEDFGTFEKVLTFDTHVTEESLDTERGDIYTVVTATGGISGRSDIDATIINTATDFKARPYSITWSPTLASRFGVLVNVESYPRITDKNRLNQMTALEFQKKIGLMDSYEMTVIYRPWMVPNRPVYNKYRTRFALTDEVSHSIPVTAGQGNPATQLILNYTRPLDEFGIPRYVTGGPSSAVFFGVPNNNKLIANALTEKTKNLKNAVEQIKRDRSKLTSSELQQIRAQLGGFLPLGQDFYNIVGAGKAEGDPEDGIPSDAEQYVLEYNELQKEWENEQINGNIKDSVDPIKFDALIKRTEDIIAKLTSAQTDTQKETSSGTSPALGTAGLRNIDEPVPGERPQESTKKDNKPIQVDIGKGSVLDWYKGKNYHYVVTDEDRETMISYLPFQGEPKELVVWTWIQRFVELYSNSPTTLKKVVQDCSRKVTPVLYYSWYPLEGNLSFGSIREGRGENTTRQHNGIDIPAPLSNPVLAVEDGIVRTANNVWQPGFTWYGKVIQLEVNHNGETLYLLYAHLDSIIVSVGESVVMGQQIGTVGDTQFKESNHSSTLGGAYHLHFEVSQIKYPPAGGRDSPRLPPVEYIKSISPVMTTASAAYVNIVNRILNGEVPSPNQKSYFYTGPTKVIKKNTPPSDAEKEANTFAKTRKSQIGDPIKTDQGFGAGVNWFFGTKDNTTIIVTPSKIT